MSKRLEWVYPFSVMGWVSHSQFVLQFMMNYYVETSEAVMGWVSHSQCFLQLMLTFHVETSEMGVSILIDGVGKPFSVRPAAYDELLCRNV